MAYDRPTITELSDQQTVELSARLEITQDQVKYSNGGVLAKVQAGGLHGLHGHLTWLLQQCFEDTADIEYLRRRGNALGIFEKEATRASGARVVNGVSGSVVDAGEILQRADGVQFVVTTGATIAAGTATVQIEAVLAGALGNTGESTPLSFVTPLSGIESVSPTGVIAGGAEFETVESYRDRVLADMREPAHGGNDADFVQWVKSTPNVNVHRVWVFKRWMGIGSVGIFFTVDGGDIPDPATVALVQDWVADREGAPAPVFGDVFIIAPAPVSVPVVVSGLNPDTPAVRAAAEFELADLFTRSANVDDGNGSATLLLSHLREAISIASGERDHVIDSPVSNVTFSAGELPVFGGVTWM